MSARCLDASTIRIPQTLHHLDFPLHLLLHLLRDDLCFGYTFENEDVWIFCGAYSRQVDFAKVT